jgi:pimeloyl-[acyl-carrier protein] methyl ester esterase
MHVEVRGTGPDLVLLHGWAMHGGVFATLCERLAGHFRLHLVDLPGHGLSLHSPVPLELDAVADNLARRLPRAAWVGWSMGGLFALRVALRHPERVRALALLCSPPRFMRGEDWPQGMEPSVFHAFAGELARDYRATIDRFLVLEAQGSDHAHSEVALLRKQVFAAGEPSPSVLEEGLALLRNTDLRAALPQLSMPSLWLAGRRDRLVNGQGLEWAAQVAPRARYRRIDRAGHAPFLSHADEVAMEILNFAAPASVAA